VGDGGRALAISLGSILLLEVVERAITGGFIQIIGIYHAASGITLALYTLACMTTLRAIRRVGEA
jgi:hypothetical protein